MKKLIIWDFDGVIADSEKLWVSVWVETLQKEKNISLSINEKSDLLVGVADKLRKERLEKYFPGLNLDDDFMKKNNGRRNISRHQFYVSDRRG